MEKGETKKGIKAIIFDAGGVLFTTKWKAVKREIMKKYGFSIFLYSDYPAEISKKFSRKLSTGKLSLSVVLKELSGLRNASELKELVKAYKRAYIKNQKLNKELFRMVRSLKNKYQLFCLTNTRDLHLEANIERGRFDDFKKIYGSCAIGFKKPDKKAFQLILKENRLLPRETLFIDDTKENIKTAKSLGLKTIIFKNNRQLIKDLKKFGVSAK